MKDFPSKDAILEWIRTNPEKSAKRDIARAFGLKGAERVLLKDTLRELTEEGRLEKRRRAHTAAGHLAPVTVLVALDPDAEGDIFARPHNWEGEAAPPSILYMPKKGDPALGPGDRFLARLTPIQEPEHLRYEARLMRKLDTGARRMLGIFRDTENGAGRLLPVDKRSDREWLIPPGATEGAQDGELIEAEPIAGPRLGLPRGRVVARLGDPGAPRQVSLIALHQYGIPDAFSPKVLAEAEAATDFARQGRTDLTSLPLLTIDPADARDHDDAVAATPDEAADNPGGHIVWVAIADVAAYVRPGTALDREAEKRGNSTYFPDRVAPMLPERLSADLCSLKEGVERPCLAVRLRLNAEGQLIGHRFERGVMLSRASLTYEQVQAAADGHPDATTEALMAEALTPLWAAYRAAAKARTARQPLDLDLPERRIVLNERGEVADIPIRERLDAHRLIEEFMILANVAAAETLAAHRRALLYRVHEEPNPDRLDALRETVEAVGLSLAKGQVLRTSHLNRLLEAARESTSEEMVNLSVLRAQTQAYYSAENYGHFGLNLRAYAHFTSPIRRYADLIVHRALIAALGLGPDGQRPEEAARLNEIAKAISASERRSMEAERDTVDRYVAAYMAEREGAEFLGRVSGVARFGLFVKLDESGADGLIPIGTLGREYYRHDPERQTLTGERSGRVIAMGMRARVRLVEAVPITGGLIFELLEATGTAPREGTRAREKNRRKPQRATLAHAKAKRRARKG
ncbi:MAG: ribonuclease R [Pseudomonadota bacterium]